MSKVYIVNKSAHDFSDAYNYGEVIFLSDKPMNRFGCNNIHRQFSEKLKDSSSDDYIVLCSLNSMNAIACAIFAKLHGKLNLLLFKNKKYVERNLLL